MKRKVGIGVMLALTLALVHFRYQLGFSFGYEDCMRSAASHASTEIAARRLQDICHEHYRQPYERNRFGAAPSQPMQRWSEVVDGDDYKSASDEQRAVIWTNYRYMLAERSFAAGASEVEVTAHLAAFDAHSKPSIWNRMRAWWYSLKV